MFSDQLSHHWANRIFRRSNAEQNLKRPWIILRQPTAETRGRLAVAAFERFEHRDGRCKVSRHSAAAAWKSEADPNLPQRNRHADQGQECEKRGEHYSGAKGMERNATRMMAQSVA
jgi:hypothetical protein